MVCQNNLIPVLEFNFNCKSLIVGYDIEMIIFPFLVDNYAFFHQDGYAIFGAYKSVTFVYVITWNVLLRARISI